MPFSRCHELFEFSRADVLLLAFAVHREQVYLVPHYDVVYDAVAHGRSPAYGRISQLRFVDSSADALHDISGTLIFFQAFAELLRLLDAVVVLFSRASSRSSNSAVF